MMEKKPEGAPISRGLSRRELLKALAAGAGAAAVAHQVSIVSAAPEQHIRLQESERIEVWTGFGQGRMADAMTGAIERFQEENEGYNVEHVIVPWGDLRDRVLASVAAGNPPDAFRGWDWVVQTDAPEGALTPLSEYFDAEGIDLADFWPATLSAMKFNDVVYGVSNSTSVRLMYYNKDSLRENGFDPENLPTSIEGWTEMGHEITELTSDSQFETVGFLPTVPGAAPFTWYAAFGGGQFWDPETQEFNINNPEMLATLEWHKSFADRYGAENIEAFGNTYGDNTFGRNTPDGVYYTGKLATWMLSTWLVNDMKEYGPDVDFGLASIPSPQGVEGFPGDIEANMYMVPTGANNPLGGFKFANFMSSSKWVALNKSIVDSVMPSRLSLANDPEVEAAASWIPLARDEIMPRAQFYGSFPAFGFLRRTMTEEAIDKIYFEGADPAEVLEDVQRRTERELQRVLR